MSLIPLTFREGVKPTVREMMADESAKTMLTRSSSLWLTIPSSPASDIFRFKELKAALKETENDFKKNARMK